jgi:mannose-6-phosphate isomerase-like protein (cupin superfamily)
LADRTTGLCGQCAGAERSAAPVAFRKLEAGASQPAKERAVTMTARQAVYIPDDLAGIGTPWGDVVTEVLAASLSAGALCCLSVRLSTASDRPAYVHHRCDEAVYVLNGPVTITVGERRLVDLEAGACVYIPRGLSRSFAADSDGARLLIIQTPADELDSALAAVGQDGGTDRPFQPSARFLQAMSACGIELVLPPERPATQHPMPLATQGDQPTREEPTIPC